jgi:glycosyltransferase involved in cell wall biosynthesis
MPIYNGIEFIDESVPSILNQTYQNWELIIGINGHPRNSIVYQLAQMYETISDKIRVIDFSPIKGKSNTLNNMLKYCKYDHVCILDVDDIWEPGKLQRQIQPELINNYDVIGTMCVYFGEMNDIVPNVPRGDLTYFNFFEGNPVINSSCLVKKELCSWDKSVDGVEDYDLWFRLKEQSRKFFNCPEVLVRHRIHNTSSFNSNGNHLLVDVLKKRYQKN